MSTTGPRFANFYRILDEPREHGALARGIRLLIGVVLTAVLVHTLVATVLHDGVGLLNKTSETELRWVESRSPATAHRLARWMNSCHDWLFRRTGIERLALTTRNPLAGPLTRSARNIFQGLTTSVRLLALRLGILALLLPLLAVLLAVAAVEGWSNWYLRRLSGARESSFLYHRFKKAAKLLLVGLLVVYLVPPLALDPVWLLMPILVTVSIAFAASLSLFKKHL